MWKAGNQYYLVTNWHVLSMCDVFTGKNLRDDAGRPNVLRTLFNVSIGSFDSRPGMSGAPVIRRSWTNHMVEPGVVAVVDTPINKFIGVYSGRVPTDHPYEAQIGLVWADYVIDEIIVGNIRDE
jgi:hypothetical protein